MSSYRAFHFIVIIVIYTKTTDRWLIRSFTRSFAPIMSDCECVRVSDLINI